MMKSVNLMLTCCVVVSVASQAQCTRKPSASAANPQVRPALSHTPSTPTQEAASQAKAAEEKAQLQSQIQNQQELMLETKSRGYWADSATLLMWEGHDNGAPVTWKQADHYCKTLALANFTNWRLPTIDELATLVEKPPVSTQQADGRTVTVVILGFQSRGGLSLSGNPWSSTRQINRFGKPYGDGWFFDFRTSKPSFDLPYWRNTKYALCVRKSDPS